MIKPITLLMTTLVLLAPLPALAQNLTNVVKVEVETRYQCKAEILTPSNENSFNLVVRCEGDITAQPEEPEINLIVRSFLLGLVSVFVLVAIIITISDDGDDDGLRN